MTIADTVERDYRTAFLGYLLHREESHLRLGYELGRRSLVEGLSMLELAKIHHEIFRHVLAETRSSEMDDVVNAASAFFLEVLATYHMTHESPANDQRATARP